MTITPQQMIEWLNRVIPWASDAFNQDGRTLTGSELIAIRQFIASHQEVRDAALQEAIDALYARENFEAMHCAEVIRSLKGKP